jgi:hypothetical protein
MTTSRTSEAIIRCNPSPRLRQSGITEQRPIRWYFSEKQGADFVRELFRGDRIRGRIEVVHIPMRENARLCSLIRLSTWIAYLSPARGVGFGAVDWYFSEQETAQFAAEIFYYSDEGREKIGIVVVPWRGKNR